jgi:hypothetical protein
LFESQNRNTFLITSTYAPPDSELFGVGTFLSTCLNQTTCLKNGIEFLTKSNPDGKLTALQARLSCNSCLRILEHIRIQRPET